MSGNDRCCALFCSDFWNQLLSTDFNRGYFTALVLMLALLVLVLVLRLILMLIFRTRRCRQIEIKSEGGDILIARDAVIGAVRAGLKQYPELAVKRIGLYRRGRHYSLLIRCDYTPEREGGVRELIERIKPRLLAQLHHLFGIDDMEKIVFRIDELHGRATTDPVAEPAEAAMAAALAEAEKDGADPCI